VKVATPKRYGLAVSGIDISSARLVPSTGQDGWLARLPGAVVWVPGSGQAAEELVSACLTAGSPTELLGRVGSRLADPEAAPWPPFAIVASRGAELVAVVHGPVEVVEDEDGMAKKLYGGEGVGSWLNRLLQGAMALRAGQVSDDEGLADLREGVIRANGFALVPPGRSRAPRQTTHQRAKVAHQPTGGARAAAVLEADNPTVIDQPLNETDVTVAEQPASDHELLGVSPSVGGGPDRQLPVVPAGAGNVRGICCPRDHLNDPRHDFCRVCGLPLVPGVPEVEGPRPPLGKLTWDNGEVHELIGAALVGRDVNLDGGVVSGELSALVPSGQNDSMSRVHAELRPSGWDVVVVDRGSTNGTFVWDEPSKAWQRLVPDEPHVIRSGAVLAFGERTATFEAVAVPAG